MANKKISQLDPLGTAPAGTDILPITDVSGTPTTKSVTVANLHSGLQAEPTEGAFVDGDKTKLDGIEAGADVTDATNVTAAGALMDSEVTNLAQVKAFDSADYATAAQGTLADSALQSLSAGALSDFDFDDNAIKGFSAEVPTEKTADHTLTNDDNGTVVVMNSGSAIKVIVPSGLATGFNCSVIQKGAGQVEFDNNSGASTINNRQSHTKINNQYGVASIVAYAADTFVLAGDTAS